MPQVSDAFVFFGATGDLAYKKIFPALQSMIKHGALDAPIIGVAKSGWTVEQLKERARDSVTKYGGGVDPEAFPKLCELLSYIDGDYKDDKTYAALRAKLGDAQLPTHYLAIPAQHVSGGGERAGRFELCEERAGNPGEALRPRPGFGAQAQRYAPPGFS